MTAATPITAATRPDRAADPAARACAGDRQDKVTIWLDADDRVAQVRLHTADFPGFESFLAGRPMAEVPALVQRLCGICPVSHALAAVKALDRLAGVDALPATAEKLRRLMQFGQIVQSHAVHVYHLAAPDLVLGYQDAANRQALVALAERLPQIATEGVLVRRFGQEVVRATAGSRTLAPPGGKPGGGRGVAVGGMASGLSREDRDMLRSDVDQVIDWTLGALGLIARLFATNPAFYARLGAVDIPLLGLVTGAGAAEFYHGGLRARDGAGAVILDGGDPAGFAVAPMAAARPDAGAAGPAPDPAAGGSRLGPLARMQLCDFLTTERAESARQGLLAFAGGRPVQGPLLTHWARLVELLHAAERISDLLDDPDTCGTDLIGDRGAPRTEAVGVVEAPRGLLLHRYRVDESGRVRACRVIAPGAHGAPALTAAIRAVAQQQLQGCTVTAALVRHIEVTIRAFDPCLSCAAPASGPRPLAVELRDAGGTVVSALRCGAEGKEPGCGPF